MYRFRLYRMLDEKEYSRWLRSAKETLESAKRDLEERDYNWACFKAHQAVEKSLKGLLWGLGPPQIGTSLPYLLSITAELGIEPDKSIEEACIRLNKHYIPTRYPDVWSEGVPEEYYLRSEAEEAISNAFIVIRWVEEIWRKLSREG